ncbi:MAG: hypothetical protein M1834_009081 [Cirrosporium novae-zelandiae]|nr:MAG: hypothetical protein M1834_009081 [Cirrosporium novae-zelandiae]
MATQIPAALKAADIYRFAHRAAQVENAKPAVAYWCNYWIVNQILSKGLNNSNEESNQYAMDLMDKLEQTKADNPENDAIKDEVAAQAYIEQFGSEVFQRADNAVRANKASKQTADTFQAAATFLEVLQVWGPLDAEVAAKIKYAKFHALRIFKAIKAGEDPNSSNPPIQTEEDTKSPESTTSPDLRQNELPNAGMLQPSLQASVEDAPSKPENLQRSSSKNNVENYYDSRSLNEPSGPARIDHRNSVGSGYFPQTSPPGLDDTSPNLPSAPSGFSEPSVNTSPMVDQPPTMTPTDVFQSFPPPSMPAVQTPTDIPPLLTQHPTYFPPPRPTSGGTQPQAYYQQPTSTPAPLIQPPPLIPAPLQQSESTVNQVVDDAAISNAQKHARWAISALNFEDVNTAIKELRIALDSLGAR